MGTYVMLTRLSPEAVARPQSLTELNEQVESRIKKECPEVKWIANYAVLGGVDYIDFFEAPDADSATKVALIVRSFGHATTETWIATPWDRFVNLVSTIKT
ncbi:GYD domain-containing protein [Syntrophus aciditrophicus]|uniref:Hypothetical cytosolic protein n=1 Tax=Syntrophus aciditrophicus (strain SB) TaxID=56780 RepID=Q2LVQ6_SYNAS|nr:GYD domain-containing protein [Syntrophus aciditrophicus]ABC78164.1 hypothetical cytosolic protein [Syntrophus aciditrophicus SB]OPY17536.1 MAG: GYD domain protein [Syntrophus sp. PtaB.Bin075]